MRALERLQLVAGVPIGKFAEKPSSATEKLFNGVAELRTYIRNNQDFIPNGERFRQRERDQQAFVESTVTKVVSKRFVKKQQMQWTPRGAYLLLQIHTKMLNDNLESTSRQWHPSFRRAAASPPTS